MPDQLLTLFFVVFGWGIVNYQNNKRETRKEGRAAADAAKKLAMEISKESVCYLTENRLDLANSIKPALDALEIELNRFPNFSSGGHLMGRFNQFADRVTGDHFESGTAPMLKQNAPEVLSVTRSRNVLLGEIERQFKIHYC